MTAVTLPGAAATTLSPPCPPAYDPGMAPPPLPRADEAIYRWRFGPVEFDEGRRELRIAGLTVDIEQKPLEVLSLLLRCAGEVVTKQELFDRVWAGRVTVDHVLATAVSKLRRELDGAGESRIATVPRVGYRFDGAVERIVVGRAPASPLALAEGEPVPARPTFVLERQLGRTRGSEVWLARQPRTRDARVFKFALDGERLGAIKREATLLRVLRDALGERDDMVRILDWNFEAPPFFLESAYGGQVLPQWTEEGHLAAMPEDDRIALFAGIVDAVAAAHGVGVLHKDLKPANVLLAPRGAGWQPRLTDFGSSRLLQPERLAALGITGLGLTVDSLDPDSPSSGTPLYLAPELLAGQSPTVRSDVYALGVMLYQLLAGDLRRPLAPGWERDIADPLLREDIAAATDTDPARRIASADALVDRLRRLPQRREERAQREAEAQGALRMRQALERNRARRPWIAATIGVLVLGLAVSGLSWQRSEQQRRIAQQQALRAEASMGVFDRALATLSTGRSGYRHDPTIREMLDYVSAPRQLPADPQVRGNLHVLLGRSWRLLGEPARGAAEYREAVRDYAKAFGEGDALTLETRYSLVRTLAYMQTAPAFAEAGTVLEEADRLAGARLRQDNALSLRAALERGIYHLNRLQMASALQALRRADRLQRRLSPGDAGMAALIRGNIADALRGSGKPAESLAWLREQEADPLLAPERIGSVSVALLQSAAASALNDIGRPADALPLALSAAEASRRFLGPDDYLTLLQSSAVARIRQALGDCRAALPLARDVRDHMARRFGEDMQATLIETGNLGIEESRCGNRDAGLADLRLAEAGLREHFGADHAAAQRFRQALAEAPMARSASVAGRH
jgi:non-specific serine/threonine protein kinase